MVDAEAVVLARRVVRADSMHEMVLTLALVMRQAWYWRQIWLEAGSAIFVVLALSLAAHGPWCPPVTWLVRTIWYWLLRWPRAWYMSQSWLARFLLLAFLDDCRC